jgi:hypothetical protein
LNRLLGILVASADTATCGRISYAKSWNFFIFVRGARATFMTLSIIANAASLRAYGCWGATRRSFTIIANFATDLLSLISRGSKDFFVPLWKGSVRALIITAIAFASEHCWLSRSAGRKTEKARSNRIDRCKRLLYELEAMIKERIGYFNHRP